jgi:hypothetical protein
MAHFRATIKGSRGGASRLGTKASGLVVTANGWEFGVKVVMRHSPILGEDVAQIHLTSGGNAVKMEKFLGEFTAKDHL